MFKVFKGPKKNGGFTLMELLLYVGIFAGISVAVVSVLVIVSGTKPKVDVKSEVQNNTRVVMEAINQQVSQAVAVSSAQSGLLSLVMPGTGGSATTTVFSLSGGTVYLKQGNNATTTLTSDKVSVDSLVFGQVVQPPAPRSISVQLTMSYRAGGNPLLVFSSTLQQLFPTAKAVTFDSDVLPASNNAYSIGASSPAWKNGYFAGNLSVGGNLGVAGGGLTYPLQVGTNSLVVTSGGNVGIGTTGPASKLHLYIPSGTFAHNYLTIENANGSYQSAIELKTATAGADWIEYIPGGTSDLRFYSNSGDKVTFQSGGNVGIGTTTPTTGKLVIYGGNLDMQTNEIIGIIMPTASSSAASKGYVDQQVSAGAGGNSKSQVFLSSGNFTVPANVTSVWITAVGGGGGGAGGGCLNGSGNATCSTYTNMAGGGGGGGGAGELKYRVPVTVSPSAVIPVVVGAAGTAGTAGTTTGCANNGGAGGAGGNTTFTTALTSVVAKGGSGAAAWATYSGGCTYGGGGGGGGGLFAAAGGGGGSEGSINLPTNGGNEATVPDWALGGAGGGGGGSGSNGGLCSGNSIGGTGAYGGYAIGLQGAYAYSPNSYGASGSTYGGGGGGSGAAGFLGNGAAGGAGGTYPSGSGVASGSAAPANSGAGGGGGGGGEQNSYPGTCTAGAGGAGGTGWLIVEWIGS